MKFLLPIALLAAGVATANSDCEAAHIVESCLTSENPKLTACKDADYECKCAAQQSIATCFNNCPDDSRAAEAQGQVKLHCGNASAFGSKSAAPTASTSKTGSASEPSTTSDASDSDSDSKSGSGSGSNSDDEGSGGDTGAAGELVLDMGGLLLGVAGVMAVVV